MATLYMHIGLTKTGSTTIQHLMWKNKKVLKKAGILYPDPGYRYDRIHFRRNAHFLIAPYIHEDGRTDYTLPPAEYEEGLDKLAKLGRTHEKIFLTDEGLWWGGCRRQNFWELLRTDLEKRGFDTRLIIYLRRQDLWMPSHWAQSIRDGKTTLGFREYIQFMKDRKYPVDYYEYISRLANVFGRENLFIRILEKGQFRGAEHTLLSDFLDIFGLSLSDGFEVGQTQFNTKFHGSFLELKRIMNYAPELRNKQKPLARELASLDLQNPLGYDDLNRFSYFAPGEQEAFRRLFEESNSRLAREYLQREDGVLFYETPADLPVFEPDDHDLLQNVILLYGKELAALLKKEERQNTAIRELKANQKALEKEVRRLRKELDTSLKKEAGTKELSTSLEKEVRTLKKELSTVRENVLLYRLKRKTRSLMGSKNK